MKILILILILAPAFALHAAEPVVVVQSATAVLVDGVNAGKPADTIRNRPELASAIQRALEAREIQQAAALAALQARLDAATAANAATVAKLVATKSFADLLTARAEIITPALVARRAKIAAELAAKQAELDALK